MDRRVYVSWAVLVLAIIANVVANASFKQAMISVDTSLDKSILLLVLRRLDVTFVYPFVGLGFILTMFLGAWLLSEPVTGTRIVGTLLVVAGVALIARPGLPTW